MSTQRWKDGDHKNIDIGESQAGFFKAWLGPIAETLQEATNRRILNPIPPLTAEQIVEITKQREARWTKIYEETFDDDMRLRIERAGVRDEFIDMLGSIDDALVEERSDLDNVMRSFRALMKKLVPK